jgi:uncharacterized protein (TIGR02284 family)
MKTMTSPPTTERRAVLSALNRCIEADMDAQKGYATAAADVRDPELKTLFQLRSDERAEFVLALQRAVTELGGSPENRGTIEGTLHRVWIEARLAVEGRSDATVLIECERGERACLAVYDTLLWVTGSNGSLPYSLRALIVKQHGVVRASLEDLRKRIVGAA